jgi:serine/threonine protein kinase
MIANSNLSVLFKGYHKITGETYAIKVVKKIKNEDDISSQLDHPNWIKMFEIFEDKKYICIVMKFCEGGKLFKQI